MARINTNIPSLIAQSNLNRANMDLAIRLERLSTGLRINRGADDPAGLITSERLRSDLAGIRKAIDNSQRAASVIATTEGSLSEVADLLNSIKGLIVESANTGGISPEELKANQLQIDSAIASITRISNTANFAGLQLLNGSLDYLTSGISNSAISQVSIFGASFGDNSTISVTVNVLQSAETALIRMTADYAGSASDGTLLSALTLELAGNEGVQILSFGGGTAMSAVVNAVNLVRSSTGVTATLASAGDASSGIILASTEFGSGAFVSVKAISDPGNFFSSQISTEFDRGVDVLASVNGVLARADGINLSVKTSTLNLELLLTEAFAQQTTNTEVFNITGGGALFQLGPEVKTNQQISFGIRSVAASRLGGFFNDGELQFLSSIESDGSNSLLSKSFETASKILENAIDEISILRGQLGAIERNTLQTNIRSLQVSFENIAAAESKIRDADFAVETSKLTRAQILVQAGISVLAIANTSAQNVLQLLG